MFFYLRKKTEMLKIKCQQIRVKPKYSIDKKTLFCQFSPTFSSKILCKTGMYYYYPSTVTSQNEIALINLFLITQVNLTILLQ